MKQEDYRACIGDKMRGQKLTKQERKAAFCVAAKVCSGKAGNEDEAKRICSMPKAPKREVQTDNSSPEAVAGPVMGKTRTPKNFMILCKNQGIDRAGCILSSLEVSGMEITDDFRNMVINAEVKCQCQK